MPSLPPPRTTELFYDGAWHPASVRESAPVSITRGLSGEGTRAEPTTATMTLGNRDGQYSPHNPASPLYGKIGRNTPIRFSVHAGGPHLALTSGLYTVSTPDSAALAIAGDLDVRIDAAADDWNTPQLLAARYFIPASISWSLSLGNDRRPYLEWSPTGLPADRRYAKASAPFPDSPGGRLVLRTVLDVDNGSGGCTVTFSYARRPDATVWTPLGAPVTSAGTTGVHDGIAGLAIGRHLNISSTPDGANPLTPFTGKVYGLQLRDAGVLKIDARPETQGIAGASSFTDNGGRVWTLTGPATLSNRHVRLEGEVPAWPPKRHISGNDSVVTINPAGVLRRLGTGRKPLDSALRRYLTAAGPVECWPLTDGTESTSGAALGSSQPMVITPGSTYAWGKGEVADWVEPVLQIKDGGFMSATLPPISAAGGSWSVDWVFSGMRSVFIAIVKERGSSDATGTWTLVFDPTTKNITLVFRTLAGGDVIAGEFPASVFDDLPHHVRLTVNDSAEYAIWEVFVDGTSVAVDALVASAAPPESVLYNWGFSGSFEAMALGYVTYWGASAPPPADVYRALIGMPGETAGTRVARVAAEQGVPLAVDGLAANTEQLGVQRQDVFLDTLEAASDADLGYLIDRRDARALTYRPRATLYNQAPALTLDYAQGVISGELRPVDDDRLTRNDITVHRDGGSWAPAVQKEGRMSVQAPPNGVGRYDTEVTLSLAADSQAASQAGWRLHLGTYEGLRYPRITVDLANPRTYALAHDILAADVGDLIRLRNLPPEYGPGDVDLIIRGYTEEIGATAWKITFVCDPGAPWQVGIYNDPVYGKYDTSGSQLASSLPAGLATFSVTRTAGLRWTIDPAEFPFTIAVGGEEMRVNSITGTGFTQTFNVVRSTNGIVKTHPAGTPVTLARPAVYAL